MGKEGNNSWLEKSAFDDALLFADEQWVRDLYDLLLKDGYDEDVVLNLVADLLVNPDMLEERMSDVNPFLSDNDALKVVLDEFANLYQNSKADEKANSMNLYKVNAVRDKMKVQNDFPYLNVDVLNNNMLMTHLNPDDEQKFRNWFSGYSNVHGVDPDPDNPEHYYDYRGYWKEADDDTRWRVMSDPYEHLTDKYKMPGHFTFSDESKFHNPEMPETTGGHWNEYGFFRPSEYQRGQSGRYITDPTERKIRQRYTESGFIDNAYNPGSHARGAFQIAPGALQDYVKATGRDVDLDNARDNEAVRDWYMNILPRYLGRDVYYDGEPEDNRLAKIYAAYNWGPGNLNEHLREMRDRGIDIYGSLDWMEGLPAETRNYVDFNVLGRDVSRKLNAAEFDSAVSKWMSGR